MSREGEIALAKPRSAAPGPLGRLEVNLFGLPALSVPMDYASDGTPLGIQFFNEFLGEYELLGFAYDYEQATLWRVAPNLALLVPEPSGLSLLALCGVLLQGRYRRSPTA